MSTENMKLSQRVQIDEPLEKEGMKNFPMQEWVTLSPQASINTSQRNSPWIVEMLLLVGRANTPPPVHTLLGRQPT